MANFPTNLDTIKKDWANDSPVKDTHPSEHNLVAESVEALETKVGVDGSAVTTTHDYKLSNVTDGDKAVSITGTETLTNKTLTEPVMTNPDFSTIENTGTLTLPTDTDTLLGKATTDTLTNKTILSTTNNVAAKSLHSATTVIDVASSTAPITGQVLQATSSTNAEWVTFASGGSGYTTFDLRAYRNENVSYYANEESTAPKGIFFKTNGLSMYVLDLTTDTVYQYTLSTAWDVTTASYASKSFSVTSQESSPYNLSFNSDGTSMYIIGISTDTVYQYTLSTAWDIGTASYASKSFSVTSQESNPFALLFNPTGTIMYIVGVSNDTIYQYTLSTGFDVSTASYASKSFSLSDQFVITSPSGLSINDNGTAIYVCDGSNGSIFEITLSTAYDISTAGYSQKAILTGLSSFTGLFMQNNGDRLFTVDIDSKSVISFKNW